MGFARHSERAIAQNLYITRALLQMEEKKVVDEVVERMMSLMKELLQEPIEGTI
jgi:hypothetical protein